MSVEIKRTVSIAPGLERIEFIVSALSADDRTANGAELQARMTVEQEEEFSSRLNLDDYSVSADLQATK